MKKVRILFVLAAIAFVLAIGCLLAFLFMPEREVHVSENEDITKVETADEMEDIAKAEIERFFNTYGVKVEQEEMIKQLKIRKEYEESYGKSYALEDVFLTNVSEGDPEGDPGDALQSDIVEKIQLYVKKYNIDESRYASMTAEEELAALEVEYGPLEESDMESVGSTIEENVESKEVVGSSDELETPDESGTTLENDEL